MPFPYEAADELGARSPESGGDVASASRRSAARRAGDEPEPASDGDSADPVARVRAILAAAGCADLLTRLPRSARTAELAAAALGVPQGAIVKSLLLLAGGEPLLVLVSGDRRADVAKVAALRGLPAEAVALAPAKVVEQLTGFPVGGVSPVTRTRDGRLLPTLMDRALFRFDEVWSAAGATRVVFSLPPARLAALAGAQIADVGGDP